MDWCEWNARDGEWEISASADRSSRGEDGKCACGVNEAESVELKESLSARQRDTARAIVRCAGAVGDVLGVYGISDDEFAEWVADGSFGEYLTNLSAGAAMISAAEVWKALTESAKNGNITAIKLYFDMLAKQKPPPASPRSPAAREIEEIREEIKRS